MFEDAKLCRENATRDRLIASRTLMAGVRARHERSAAQWDMMAEHGEEHAKREVAYLATRRPRTMIVP